MSSRTAAHAWNLSLVIEELDSHGGLRRSKWVRRHTQATERVVAPSKERSIVEARKAPLACASITSAGPERAANGSGKVKVICNSLAQVSIYCFTHEVPQELKGKTNMMEEVVPLNEHTSSSLMSPAMPIMLGMLKVGAGTLENTKSCAMSLQELKATITEWVVEPCASVDDLSVPAVVINPCATVEHTSSHHCLVATPDEPGHRLLSTCQLSCHAKFGGSLGAQLEMGRVRKLAIAGGKNEVRATGLYKDAVHHEECKGIRVAFEFEFHVNAILIVHLVHLILVLCHKLPSLDTQMQTFSHESWSSATRSPHADLVILKILDYSLKPLSSVLNRCIYQFTVVLSQSSVASAFEGFNSISCSNDRIYTRNTLLRERNAKTQSLKSRCCTKRETR